MERTADLPATNERATSPVTDRVADRPAPPVVLTGGDEPAKAAHGSHDRPAPAGVRRPTVRLGYLPSLDGLRAVAVMAVLTYHAGVSWLPGGFLGVEVFFVISGYLITCLLLAERRATGTVSLRNFWVRRARRLLPALYAVLVVTSAWWLLFVREEVRQLRGDVVAALTYVTNWWLIFSDQSYFEQAGRPSPLRHLWSLAVEEQFYLIWPLLFAGLVAVTRGSRRRAVTVLVAGAGLSALTMYLLFDPTGDPSRAYYGTDARASGLLLGAALGFLLPPWTLRRRTGRGAPAVIDGVGIAALAGLAWFLLRVNEFDPFVYRRGFVLLDTLTVVLIVAVVHPAGLVCRWVLSRRPVVWVGRRSYGIYLWHWPVFVLTRPGLDIGLTGTPALVLRFAVTFVLAAVSYRFVEEPIRAGTLTARSARLPFPRRADPSPAAARAVVAVSAGLVVAVLGLGLWTSSSSEAPPPGFEQVVTDGTIPPPTAPGGPSPTTAGPTTASPPPEVTPPPPPPSPPSSAPTTTAPAASSSTVAPTSAPAAAPTTAAAQPPATSPTSPVPPVAPTFGDDATAIGDSVMAGAKTALKERMPGLYMNAAVGRQWHEAPGIASALGQAGLLRPVVIMNLGTNGTVTGGILDDLFGRLGGRRVLLVNTRVDRSWMDLVNSRLAEAASRHANAVLVDWASVSAGHPEYFVADGVHLTKAGARAYADAIASRLH